MTFDSPVRTGLRIASDAARTGTAKRVASRRRTAASLAAVSLASLVALCAAGCSTPPKDLDLALDKRSEAGAYRVSLVPPAATPAVNQMHSWTVKLAAIDGTPVRGARFTVDGGMPQHGHGLPTRPRVTREESGGTYRLDGVKFSMTGWWELKLGIEGSEGADRVTFNTVVDPPSVRP